jgi:vitamin B12 transporter
MQQSGKAQTFKSSSLAYTSPETGLSSSTLKDAAGVGLKARARNSPYSFHACRAISANYHAGLAWKGYTNMSPANAGASCALFILCLLSSIAPVRADTLPASAGDSPATDNSLVPLVVTATRTAQPVDRTGTSMSVISGTDIDTQQLTFVSDALAQTPGVSVSRDGGPGQTTSLFIRGAEAGESLILVDGIRINDPSAPDGAAVLGDLLVNSINRIEILRGPQSTLYGSDAIGGVVNVLTERGGAQPFAGTLEAQGGTYDTYRLNGAAHGTVGELDYGGAVNYYDTRGISAACACDGNTEPDGYRNLGVTANLRYHATDAISIDLHGFYTKSHTDIDGYPPPNYTFQDDPEFGRDQLIAGYAGINGSWLNGQISQRVAIVASDSDRRFYGVFGDAPPYSFTPAQNFYAEGGSTRLEYQGIIEVDATDELTYGAETQLSTINTESMYDSGPTEGRDRLTGYYGQWQTTLGQQLTLTGGLRYDQDQQFGGHTSVKLAGAWRLGDGSTVVRANYGGGFKAPTLYEEYSSYSNPNATLAPEKAAGWEAGLDHDLLDKKLRASITYFSRSEHDLIDFDDCFSADTGCAQRPEGFYYNVDRAHVRGIETRLLGHPADGWSAWLNYTNMRAIDELTGLTLARRPHATDNVGFSWTSKDGSSLGASYGFVGARFDDAGNTTPLESSEDVSLFASLALGSQLKLIARADNLFKNRSEPTAGYGYIGEQFYAGLRLSL